jgi:hypothetical protein
VLVVVEDESSDDEPSADELDAEGSDSELSADKLAEQWAARDPQAVEAVKKISAGDYDSMIVDAFVKAFGQKAQAAAQ